MVLALPTPPLPSQEVAGSEKEWPAELVVLAMGFRHTEHAVTKGLGIELGTCFLSLRVCCEMV